MSKKRSKPYLSRRWCHRKQIARETWEQCCEPPAYQPRSLSLTRICWWTCLPSRWSGSWIPHCRNIHGRKNHAVVHHPRFKSHKGEELGVDRLRDFLKDQSGEPDCDQFLLFCKQMTDELCDLINKDTISQAKSPLWYALRFSRDCILSLWCSS